MNKVEKVKRDWKGYVITTKEKKKNLKNVLLLLTV